MKYFAFLLCLFTLPAFAQRGEPVSDSTYLQMVDTVYYSVQVIKYTKGPDDQIVKLRGTATEVLNQYQSEATNKSLSWAQDIAYTSTIPKQALELKRLLEAVKTQFGIAPLDSLHKYQMPPLQVPGWAIRVAGAAAQNITFSFNAQGQPRYRIGAGTFETMTVFPGLIIFNNFPAAGRRTLFARTDTGDYVSPGRVDVLRRPGSTANSPINQIDGEQQTEPATPRRKRKN
jgi:hypothetical protein